MNSKHMAIFAIADAVCGSVWADQAAAKAEADKEEAPKGWNWAMGEGITYNETSIAASEVFIGFDSKYLSYGLVDNNDPIWTYGADVTFFDWINIGVLSINDMSRYGVDAGYKNRQGKSIEVHPTVTIQHAFSPDDYSWLPTTVEFALGFDYEYHPRVCTGQRWIAGEWNEGDPRGGDTYFYTFEIGLPDLWFEPAFLWEHDAMRDHGNYLNLEIGHTFALIDGEGEDDDPTLAFRLSAAQGWGDKRRISAYLPDIHDEEADGLEHQGFMDTCFKGELTWNICAGVTLSGYVAYSDYLLDPRTREASRHYTDRDDGTGVWENSWNFVCGAALAVAF